MATLDPNTLIGILQGKLGNLVFVRTKEGKIIVRHRPVRDSDRTEPIRVVAVDDFEVLSVAVTLSDASGLLLEHGLALPQAGHWLYLTQAAVIDEAAVVIHVTATDRPGHAITKTLHHALLPE